MNTIVNKKESKRTWGWLIFVLLLGTNFLGLMPFAGYVNGETKPIILAKCLIFLFFAVKTYNPKNKFDKWLLFLWVAFLINKLSSVLFRNQSIFEVPFQGSFIYDFGFYYIISYIKPTIHQVEKAILYLGTTALVIYFIQYAMLPTFVVESLVSGWRSKDIVGEFDIKRFTITGEAIILLYGFLSLNRFLYNRCKVYIFAVLATLGFVILHGYRSIMFAYVFVCIILYFKVNRFRFNKATLGIILLFIGFIFLVNCTSLFDNVLATIADKNEHQSSLAFEDLDRIIEWSYFYENIGKPWEWMFGAGFIGKNLTDQSIFINWVDLGFIGLSFMGGLLLTCCWLKLLFLSICRQRIGYEYIMLFPIYLILSTITLNVAFSDKCIIIQSLFFYLCAKVNFVCKNESCILFK